ncbi:MAG: rRNA maturation RNase YbeY [Chitinophagaceae bacterium]|nr:rRNA maturation RNase YbeY [Chitinophagaceae bacterium]
MRKPAVSPVIKFHFLFPFQLKDRRRLKLFTKELSIREEKPLGSLDYIFCSDDYLYDINMRFLQHDDLTDIITFDLSESENSIDGEIYISIERVRENARLFKTGFTQELHRVMFHGVLHLFGYGDKSPAEKKLMRKKEDECLALYDRS